MSPTPWGKVCQVSRKIPYLAVARQKGEMRRRIPLTNDFQQAGERFRSLSKKDQDNLVDNIIDPLGHATMDIHKRIVGNLKSEDIELGNRVAQGLKL